MVQIHCVFTVSPPAPTLITVKEHACQAAKIDDSLRRMWRRQQALLCLLMFPISLSLYLYFPVWRACASVALDEGELWRIFPFFTISPLPSSSLRVPCCFSCIVRLQVVWEQDLWEHMRAGETPWLTWLLRGRDRQTEKEIKADTTQEYFFRNLKGCMWFPILMCSK